MFDKGRKIKGLGGMKTKIKMRQRQVKIKETRRGNMYLENGRTG